MLEQSLNYTIESYQSVKQFRKLMCLVAEDSSILIQISKVGFTLLKDL